MMSSVTSSIDGAFAVAQSLTPVEKLELISVFGRHKSSWRISAKR